MAHGGAELGAGDRAHNDRERGGKWDLAGQELAGKAGDRGQRRDRERAPDRHTDRNVDDDEEQRYEEESAAGADETRGEADAARDSADAHAAEGQWRLVPSGGVAPGAHEDERGGHRHHGREDEEESTLAH